MGYGNEEFVEVLKKITFLFSEKNRPSFCGKAEPIYALFKG